MNIFPSLPIGTTVYEQDSIFSKVISSKVYKLTNSRTRQIRIAYDAIDMFGDTVLIFEDTVSSIYPPMTITVKQELEDMIAYHRGCSQDLVNATIGIGNTKYFFHCAMTRVYIDLLESGEQL